MVTDAEMVKMIKPGNRPDKFKNRLNNWNKKPEPLPKPIPPPLQEPEPKNHLSFVIPCMGRLDFLKQTIQSVISQPHCCYILVDWSCPENSGDWVIANYPSAKVIKVEGQKFFNLSRARNVGGKAAITDWLCFLDVDMILHEDFADIVHHEVLPGYFGEFGIWDSGFCGTMVVERSVFNEILYNEEMEGWGSEDWEFRHQLVKKEIKPKKINRNLASHINHGERSKYYEEKNIDISTRENQRKWRK